jgi:hypothetical protein
LVSESWWTSTSTSVRGLFGDTIWTTPSHASDEGQSRVRLVDFAAVEGHLKAISSIEPVGSAPCAAAIYCSWTCPTVDMFGNTGVCEIAVMRAFVRKTDEDINAFLLDGELVGWPKW